MQRTKLRHRRVTLTELCEHTGLSLATVSHTINRDEGDRYSPATSEKVYKALEVLGYLLI